MNEQNLREFFELSRRYLFPSAGARKQMHTTVFFPTARRVQVQ